MRRRRPSRHLQTLLDDAFEAQEDLSRRVLRELAVDGGETLRHGESVRLRRATTVAAVTLVAILGALWMWQRRAPAPGEMHSDGAPTMQFVWAERQLEGRVRGRVESRVLNALFVGDMPE